LFQIHADPDIPGPGKVVWDYVRQLMHRDAKDRKNNQSQAGVHKDISKREITAYINPYQEGNSKKNDA